MQICFQFWLGYVGKFCMRSFQKFNPNVKNLLTFQLRQNAHYARFWSSYKNPNTYSL